MCRKRLLMLTLSLALAGGVAAANTSCDANSDSCEGSHSSLFAIAHDHNDYAKTILYRVTLPEKATGSQWGDGTNGFFYRVSVDGGNSWQRWVPFNGVGVASDGAPTLRPFSFIVKASTSTTQLSVEACTSNYQSDNSGNPVCTKALWTDTYTTLPSPAVGLSGLPTGFSLELLTASATVYNNGVYGTRILVEPQVDDAPASLTQAQIAWLYDHLVFLDPGKNIYTNDVFDDGSTTHPSFAALTIDEAAFPTTPDSGAYVAKFGRVEQPVQPIDPTQSPNRQFWVYSTNKSNVGSGQPIQIGLGWLYDASADCLGALSGDTNSKDSACGGLAPAGATPTATADTLSVTVIDGSGLETQAQVTYQAGKRSQRTVTLAVQDSDGLCTSAVNPLAVYASSAINLPNYVISDSLASGTWQTTFADALYYVLPTGFGNCASDAEPFCERTSGYAAYVPHYRDGNGQGGSRNGGGTDQPLVGSFILADQYRLPALADLETNRLVWFDNCGYGHKFSDSELSARLTLPKPPFNRDTYAVEFINAADEALVLTKDCCASYYQKNVDSCSQDSKGNLVDCEYDPPEQIGAGFGLFLGHGETQNYETIFGDEAFTAYGAAGGNELFRFTSGAQGSTVMRACPDTDATLDFDDAQQPSQLRLYTGSGGSITCTGQGACPADMQQGTLVLDGKTYASCTTTQTAFGLHLDLWRQQPAVSDAGAVLLAAWGGKGKKGHDGSGYNAGYCCKGGAGGDNGLAQTVLKSSNVPDALYFYVGTQPSDNGGGGSSTIVAEIALSTKPQSTWSNASTIDDGGLHLLAGGGGGGGHGTNENDDPFEPAHVGGHGGYGGVATANASSLPGVPVSGGGHSGYNHGSTDTGGHGGADGKGGAGHVPGNDGIGGFGAIDTPWRHGGPLVPLDDWTAGNGGNYQQTHGGGNGGGGFGGGANGGTGDQWGHGGGGGGSWAAGNTAHLSAVLPSATSSPGAHHGAVMLAYQAPCASPLCLVKGELMSVGKTQGSACLQAADAGRLLENANSHFRFNTDGNLVFYASDGTKLWQSGTGGKGVEVCFPDSTGDLVINDADNKAVWSSETNDEGGYLVLNNCTVAILDSDGTAVWSQDHNSDCD